MVTQEIDLVAGPQRAAGGGRRGAARGGNQPGAGGGVAPAAPRWRRGLARGLAGICALLALVPTAAGAHGPAAVGSAGADGAADAHVLLHVCSSPRCARAADWAPYEQQVQALFRAGGWGQDPAVLSHADPHQETWARWAAEHVSYVDEPVPSVRRMALEQIRWDWRGRGTVHIFRVPDRR